MSEVGQGHGQRLVVWHICTSCDCIHIFLPNPWCLKLFMTIFIKQKTIHFPNLTSKYTIYNLYKLCLFVVCWSFTAPCWSSAPTRKKSMNLCNSINVSDLNLKLRMWYYVQYINTQFNWVLIWLISIQDSKQLIFNLLMINSFEEGVIV